MKQRLINQVAPELSCLAILQVLQLADSALPVGSMSHSFGLEMLASEEDIVTNVGSCGRELGLYIADSLSEMLLLDAVFCREAHDRAVQQIGVHDLNEQLSALRLPRESREASLALGRRFAILAAAMHPESALAGLASAQDELHYAVAFGYTLGTLGADSDLTVSAFLHQSVLNTISAAQRLFPLGQTQAARIAWDLKPAMLEAVERSRGESCASASSFGHLPELASMRHSCLPTRLFIS